MMKKTSNLVIKRVFKIILSATPILGAITILYKFIDGLFPMFSTKILADLLDSINLYFENKQDILIVAKYGIILIVGYSIKQLFQLLSSVSLNAGVYEKGNYYSKKLLNNKLSELELIDFDDSNLMDSYYIAKDCIKNETISSLFMSYISIIVNTTGIFSIIYLISQYNKLFIGISLISVVPYFINRIIRGKEFYKLKHQNVKEERYNNYLWKILTDKKYVKENRVYATSEFLQNKWSENKNDIDKQIWDLEKKDSLSFLLCDSIRIFGYIISIWLTFILVKNNKITIGEFGACIAAFSSIQNQFKNLLIELGRINEKSNLVKDFLSFLDINIKYEDNATEFKQLQRIELKSINFKYPQNEKNTINNLSLKIEKGEKIIIVGDNGSGKSTLSKIILGLYYPSKGEILYNNEHVNKNNIIGYRNKFSFLTQENIMYYLSVGENVFISKYILKNDVNRIENVLKECKFDYKKKDLLLSSQLGSNFSGAELSGGERQKLALARCMFRPHEILLLDEPTSSLDPILEVDTIKSIIQNYSHRTMIVVSHRIGLCPYMDKIVVMKDGKIVEMGKHNELIKKGGIYEKLYEEQSHWYDK